jgi:hypothetical protein
MDNKMIDANEPRLWSIGNSDMLIAGVRQNNVTMRGRTNDNILVRLQPF